MNISFDQKMMQRCLQLAQLGKPLAYPNPLVGAVIVLDGKIIGEGYHAFCGEAHAEVNAINSVTDKESLKQASIYVSLEPCSHFGKTPPCADLIVKHQFKRVIVGTIDPYSEVSGKGIEHLRNAGIHADVGVLEEQCKAINNRFFYFHQNKTPYTILKWAQTANGFIDAIRTTTAQKPLKISNPHASRWVHQLRSEADGILVGARTFLMDRPQLSTRLWPGNHPLRIIVDPKLETLDVIEAQTDNTLVFHRQTNWTDLPPAFVALLPEDWSLEAILEKLYLRNIQCILVEGGSYTLQQFFEHGLWNEAYQLVSETHIKQGVKGPSFNKTPSFTKRIDQDLINIYWNEKR